jgi:outer membrane protein insertion porin family
MRAATLARLVLLAVFIAAPALARNEPWGANVASVSYTTDAPFDVARIEKLVTVVAGAPLTMKDAQRSIKAIYATGDFHDVRIEAESRGLDVAVTFLLSLNYRVSSIEIEGLERDRQRASAELKVRTGDVLSLDAVDRSAVAVQEWLARRGHLEATVDPEVSFVRAENRAGITFHVAPGPTATLARVEFEGNLGPFTAAELIGTMRHKIGSTYRIADARGDADRIESYLVRKHRRTADARFLRHEYDPETNLVTLHYRVVAGPSVRMEVDGVPRDEVRRWLRLRKSEAYTEDVVDRAAERIVAEYQKRGYFFATVDIEETRVDDELVVTLKVRKGERYRVDEVIFEGNAQISDRRLRRVVTAGPTGGIRRFAAGLLRRGTGVTQSQLEEDRSALESFYALEGFGEAAIGAPVGRPLPDGSIDIVFPIQEGPRTLISQATTEGIEQVDAGDLPRLVARAGDPLNTQTIATDVIRLKSFYGDLGYVEAQVAPRIDTSADRTSASVAYSVTEGPKVAIGEVVARGNTYTDSDVIVRKAGLDKGEPFSYRAVLGAQRELYRLGIFQRVDILHERAGTSLSERNVTIQVEEGKNLTLSGAVGYSTETDFGASVSAFHRNLFGSARYAGISARKSGREEMFSLTYREPFIFNYDVPIQLTTFKSKQWRSDRDARIDRLGTYLEASRVIRERSRWSLRYEYKIVECADGEVCAGVTGDTPIPGLPREDQESRISSITPAVFWDSRDDAINPSKGLFASASLEYAAPALSAEADFLKWFLQSAWYRQLTQRTLFAVSARVGMIDPGPPVEGDVPGTFTTPVPYSERFLAGGENTHRAFNLDELGILGETLTLTADGDILPIGGNALVLINAEYRFPLFGALAGSVFVDAGNVWREIGDVDAGQFRYGAGTGLRYLTPVGPIRFDVGWKIDREKWEKDRYALFLTLGYAF